MIFNSNPSDFSQGKHSPYGVKKNLEAKKYEVFTLIVILYAFGKRAEVLGGFETHEMAEIYLKIHENS